MKRRETEISQGSEILRNGKYKEIESLNGIIDDKKEVLEKLLSIRIPFGIDGKLMKWRPIEQYNIETEKYITNITTHQGLDLHLQQYNKADWKREIYSPYSTAGYSIFVNLLCAHYECFKKRPILNFPNADIEWRNKQVKHHDVPMMNEVTASHRASYIYLHHYNLFQEDKEWIRRIISPKEKNDERTDEWFGIKWDEVIFQFIDSFYSKDTRHKFFMEKDLINLHLQAIIDVNRRVSWPTNTLNFKKTSDVLYKILENPEIRADSEKLDFRMRYEPLKGE